MKIFRSKKQHTTHQSGRVCCAMLLLICAGIGLLHACRSSAQVTANVPEMPLLKAWVESVDAGKVPDFAPSRLITSQQVPGFDWRDTSNVFFSDIKAKYYSEKTVFLLKVTASEATQMSQDYFFYGTKKLLEPTKLKDTSSSWLSLLESQGPPIAGLTKLGSGHSASKPNVISRSVRLRILSNTLQPIPPIKADPIPKTTLFASSTSRPLMYHIHDSVTREIIASLPLKSKEAGDYQPHRSIDQRMVKGKLMVAYTQVSSTHGMELIWNTRSNDRWFTKRQEIDPLYLKRLLPASLAGMQLDLERTHSAKIWADGSIIFVLHCLNRVGNDLLQGRLLVKQSSQGQPVLLTWSFRHVYDPDTDGATREESKASDAFNHVWYPQGKQIVSHFLRSRWSDELMFDVDTVNKTVFCLRSGKLFAVDVP